MDSEKEFCECCQKLVKDAEDNTVKSNLLMEKYVPHKYIYRRVCIDCVEQNKHAELKEHGFVECGYSMDSESEKEETPITSNTVLFDGQLRHGTIKITENAHFYHLKSDGHWINFQRYKKYTIGKTGLLWGHWGEKYRDGLSARFFKGDGKYSFEVVSRTEMIIHKIAG